DVQLGMGGARHLAAQGLAGGHALVGGRPRRGEETQVGAIDHGRQSSAEPLIWAAPERNLGGLRPRHASLHRRCLIHGRDGAAETSDGETHMPRYMVERSFPQGLAIPMTDVGRRVVQGVVKNNAELGVTWVHSYVNADRTQTFCVYDGPSPEAIRKVADRNGLPVNKITEVSVLDPYFYRP